jgi:hypothetical protein
MAVSTCVALLAGCSLVSPATFAPEQKLAAVTDAPPTTVPSPAAPPASASVPSSAAPPTGPVASPEPPAVAMRWRSVVKPLTAPAAWLDFGFAANGDVIAIGTEHLAADRLRLFVARFSPSGRKRSQHDLTRTVTPLGSDWLSIDPSDDSVVIDDYYRPTGLFTVRRFNSATGRNMSNVSTASGINRLAIDARGHQYGLPQYGVDGNVYAAVVRLDARGRVKFGVDFWLRTLTGAGRPHQPGILGFPTAITVGLDGRVIVVDEPDTDAQYQDGTPRRTAVVTSLAANLSAPRQWELPVEWPFGSQAFGAWSHGLAIAGAADGSLYVGEPVLDETGATVLGARIQHFGPAGELLGAWGTGATWGTGALDAGAGRLGHPAVDGHGRLWAIELDPATNRSVIAILEPG